MTQRATLRNDYSNFRQVYAALKYALQYESKVIHTETWQGITIMNKPEMATHELEDVSFSIPRLMSMDLQYYRTLIGPNCPWADDHFVLERVSGNPVNPGETYKKWPWGLSADKFRVVGDQFNHTYAERYWPKHAGQTDGGILSNMNEHHPLRDTHEGIRYEYGDLQDVVNLLARNPLTRNAYLPIWFPEDTGIVHGGRAPCSLGYLFRMRGDELSISYDIRSCDFRRHFQDDVYLTVRLLLWVIEQLRELDMRWNEVIPGRFTMHIGSLHIFKNDFSEMFRQ